LEPLKLPASRARRRCGWAASNTFCPSSDVDAFSVFCQVFQSGPFSGFAPVAGDSGFHAGTAKTTFWNASGFWDWTTKDTLRVKQAAGILLPLKDARFGTSVREKPPTVNQKTKKHCDAVTRRDPRLLRPDPGLPPLRRP
jgi:hypothetical protein